MTTDLPVREIVRKNTTEGASSDYLDVIPSNIELSEAELTLAGTDGKEFILKNRLAEYFAQLAKAGEAPYDYVFFDCPPSMGILVVNALTAATEVLVTIQAEYYALEGIALLTKTIGIVNENWNPALKITGALITMFDSRSNLSTDVFSEVKNALPEQTLSIVIPRNVRVAEAPSHSESVITYDPRSTGAVAYREAALEFANMEGE